MTLSDLIKSYLMYHEQTCPKLLKIVEKTCLTNLGLISLLLRNMITLRIMDTTCELVVIVSPLQLASSKISGQEPKQTSINSLFW